MAAVEPRRKDADHDEQAGMAKLFSPRSVVVVGASANPAKVGNAILRNMARAYRGKLLAVNPGHRDIEGTPCFPSVEQLPQAADLAVVVVRARDVPGVLEQCGRKGIRQAVVISGGFKETGPEGAKLERNLRDVARAHGIRVLGPNCFGVINTEVGLNATFAANMPRAGQIAVMSQSGALCAAILDWAEARGQGFSKFVSLGNKADLSETEMLQAWKDDPKTRVIVAYLEGVKNGRAFIEVARQVTAVKPVVVIKSGRTSAGARAASSHTGTLAGSDTAYTAAFAQCGVLRIDSFIDAFELAAALAQLPAMRGRGIGVVTNAGGPGIMAADACEMLGLQMARLAPTTVELLRQKLPSIASFYNPVDVIGSSGVAEYSHAIRWLQADPNVHALLVVYTPLAILNPMELAREVAKLARESDKPLVACLVGGAHIVEATAYLRENGVPVATDPNQAMYVYSRLWEQAQNSTRRYGNPRSFDVDRARVKCVFDSARADGRKVLGMEALELFDAYGIPHARYHFARNVDDATEAARVMEYPLVLKVVSEKVSHKTEAGGVRLNIRDEEELRLAYDKMIFDVHRYAPDAFIEGVLVQEMVQGGREVIVGSSDDPQFGPLLMFGLGGIYVEVLRDVAFRVAPVSEDEVRQMLREVRASPLLTGVRGEAPADVDALVEVLQRVSQLVTDFPEIRELDLNPVMVFRLGDGCKAIDLRVVLD